MSTATLDFKTTGFFPMGSPNHNFTDTQDEKRWRRGSQSSSTSTFGRLTSGEYAGTLKELRSLMADEDEDDRPTREACNRAFELLRAAAERIGDRFPKGNAATGPGRSVRLIWLGRDSELRLVIGGSATNRSYIYWWQEGCSGVDEFVEGSRLADYLTWIDQGL